MYTRRTSLEVKTGMIIVAARENLSTNPKPFQTVR